MVARERFSLTGYRDEVDGSKKEGRWAPRNVDLHRGNVDLHRGNVDVHRGNVDVHRANVDVHRGNVDLHRADVGVHRGAVRVYACTLVDDDDDYDLGADLDGSMDYRIMLGHHRCYSCFAHGASCTEC